MMKNKAFCVRVTYFVKSRGYATAKPEEENEHIVVIADGENKIHNMLLSAIQNIIPSSKEIVSIRGYHIEGSYSNCFIVHDDASVTTTDGQTLRIVS